MNKKSTSKKRPVVARKVEPVVGRPKRIGWYWVSEDDGRTWQPCCVFKYGARLFARDSSCQMWQVSKSRGRVWSKQIYPPNPTADRRASQANKENP